ncbi:uncharacterized protein MYCFIDRAFT_207638 [Pseudocercospora fijiensis CIRAD86]|uniref:Uncharacterized protein n=1 Tax=Pseudocercospora fijiensis (strain CIRAD86) TaxID=383855 RepID=M2YZ17_PSEFD|nr:uncharacterized protein MYCFIDRAFT_207638 [Pseudocercospora fijiensis CIRAD86]EME82880.1 hypothetical protein MYCFIDRAFT_207638 [Pseudocercospora fijiensis CIRAD86]
MPLSIALNKAPCTMSVSNETTARASLHGGYPILPALIYVSRNLVMIDHGPVTTSFHAQDVPRISTLKLFLQHPGPCCGTSAILEAKWALRQINAHLNGYDRPVHYLSSLAMLSPSGLAGRSSHGLTPFW